MRLRAPRGRFADEHRLSILDANRPDFRPDEMMLRRAAKRLGILDDEKGLEPDQEG